MHLIKKFCLSSDLSTYDPYDIWKTKAGIKVKRLFYTNRLLGGIPALLFSCWDLFLNNKWRIGYQKQQYPIVHALAALTLMNQYEKTNNSALLDKAEEHLGWLINHASKGYSGYCWGLGFKWPVADGIIYDSKTPYATHTPYALEAFYRFDRITDSVKYSEVIKSCFQFYEHDLQIMYETDEEMAVSYGPFPDRIVTNAVAYTAYVYTLFLDYFPDQQDYIKNKIKKLYQFVVGVQREDGSWLYIPNDNASFIDCFHSCFIIKNLVKANKKCRLEGVEQVIKKGYEYIYRNFLDQPTGLYKRFTVKNKFSLTKFDLYDNAEMMNVMNLLGDKEGLHNLTIAVDKYFIRNYEIYSIIDILGIKRNRQMLRWAVMPYLYTISTLH